MKTHNHNQCIHTALEKAVTLCQQKGVRLTLLRRQVLELIWQNHHALGAYTLMGMLEKQSDRQRVAPPTVYRALDFLIDHGLIHKIYTLNAYIGCLDPQRSNQTSTTLFICEACHHTEEVGSQAIQQAINLSASQHRFQVTKQVIELVGLCAACQAASKPEPIMIPDKQSL